MTAVNVAYTGDKDGFCTNDDRVSMGVQAATHWGALSHVGYGGKLYNDVDDDVVTESGAAELGIDAFGPIATRRAARCGPPPRGRSLRRQPPDHRR